MDNVRPMDLAAVKLNRAERFVDIAHTRLSEGKPYLAEARASAAVDIANEALGLSGIDDHVKAKLAAVVEEAKRIVATIQANRSPPPGGAA